MVGHGDDLVALVASLCCFLAAPTDSRLFGVCYVACVDANKRETRKEFGSVGEGGVMNLAVAPIAEVLVGFPELCVGLAFYRGIGVVGILPGFLYQAVVVIAGDDEDGDAGCFYFPQSLENVFVACCFTVFGEVSAYQ